MNVLLASTKSHIIDGRGLSASQAEEEAQRIHKENIQKMSQMSEEEILAEQQELMKILGTFFLSFSIQLKSSVSEFKLEYYKSSSGN